MLQIHWPGFSKSVTKRDQGLNLGLVLSSGCAGGLCHVGVIQVLEEHGIRVNVVAGSSMGAYVGALWAAGHNGEQLEALAREMRGWRDVLHLADFTRPRFGGWVKGNRIREKLEKSLGDVTFEDLHRELYVVTTDIRRVIPIILHEGNVINAVLASLAIPGLVAPVEIDGRLCSDGGICQPLPVRAIKHLNLDGIIAVTTEPSWRDFYEQSAGKKLLGVSEVMRRAIVGRASELTRQEAALADIVIRPLSRCGCHHDYYRHEQYINAGREAAERHLDEIKKLARKTKKHDKH